MAYYKCGSIHPTQNSNVVVDTASGAIANFQTPLAMPLLKTRFDFKATQEAGTPTPQSPKAISGVSEVSVIHTGANLWDEQTHDSYLLSTTGQEAGLFGESKCSANFNVIKPNTGVWVVPRANKTTYIYFYDENYQFIERWQGGLKYLTTPSNACYFKLSCYGYGATYQNDMSVNYPYTDRDYHAYNGSTTLINLGGTYYGGYITQDKNGKRELVVTHELIVCAGAPNETWEFYNVAQGKLFRRYLSTSVKNTSITSSNTLCEKYIPTNSGNRTNLTVSGEENRVDFINNDFSDLASFKAELSNSPVRLVIPIATPFTVALPDGEPIKSFWGTNNIYADTGDTSLQFRKIG